MKTLYKLLLASLFLLWSLLTPVVFAAPQASDLKKINTEIKTTEKQLQKNQKQNAELTSELEKSERALSQIETEKNALQNAVIALQHKLDKLNLQEKELLLARDEQEKNIAAQINASYKLGHEKNVKVILNEKDSRSLSRSLAYSDYITRARLASLKTFEATLAQLADTKTAINSNTAELVSNQKALSEKSAIAKASLEQRNITLKALQLSIKNDESKIAQLKENQNRLQALFRQIRIQQAAAEKATIAAAKKAQEQLRLEQKTSNDIASKPAETANKKTVALLDLPADHLPFAQTKGKLRWPAQGKLDNRFGQKRQPGNFRWDGVRFISSLGTEINAVHSGKVVFADWFRGKGLLLIIDHGNGYMTLYAHNQTLLKKPGELVKSGDVISTVGNSGGLTSPELYFELRYQGEPVNPGNWFINKG